MDISSRISTLSNMLRPGGSLVTVAWTLGIGASPPPPVTLPLAELLFWRIELAACGVPNFDSVTALDRSSWGRWLRRLGFDVAVAEAAERPAGQLELLREHSAKVRFLAHDELTTAAVVMTAVQPRSPRMPVTDAANNAKIAEPETALVEARRRFDETEPGDQLLVGLPSTNAVLSTTSALVAWLRAGFETVDLTELEGSPAVRLVKPLTVADIDRFGGKS